MRSSPPLGDLALAARPASAETFAPFGRLLGLGDRARLGRHGAALVTLDEARRGPRRFTHVQRYPQARRLLLPLGDTPLLVVVLGAGDPPAGPPAAFRTAPGQGVLLEAGVWHAGPIALADGILCEILETHGAVDRLDRRALAALTGVEAVRIQLPEEPGAPGPGLDLEAPGAVLVENRVRTRLSVGLLLLEDLDVPSESPRLTASLEEVAKALRQISGAGRDIGGRFGVDPVRRMWREMGLDPSATPPAYERLVREAVEHGRVEQTDVLLAASQLVSLQRQLQLGIYDAGNVTGPFQLRLGREGETLLGADERAVSVGDVPVLCDREGPFASPVGRAPRARASAVIRRALVALYLPAGTEEGDVLAHLEEASAVLREHGGGREAGRVVL